MRNFINIVEAKAETADLSQITPMATEIARVFGISTWDGSWAREVIARIKSMKDVHDSREEREEPEDRVAFDPSDVIMDVVTAVWKKGRQTTFALVKPEVNELVHEYQKRHGERLDREAGYVSDFHYIEASDWLDAMEVQKSYAVALDNAEINGLADIAKIIELTVKFTDLWRQHKSLEDEPIAADELTTGLSRLIPLLLFISKHI